MVNKGEIAGYPTTGLCEPRCRDLVQDNADFDPLARVLEP
jgi:hypothetical protein